MRLLTLAFVAIACTPSAKPAATTSSSVQSVASPLPGATKPDQQLQVIPQSGHAAEIESLSMSPDGSLLASGGKDRVVLVWDLRSGRLLRRFEERAEIHHLAFGADGNTLYVIAGTRITALSISAPPAKAVVWSVDEAGWMGASYYHPETIAASPDGQHVMYSLKANAVVLGRDGTRVPLIARSGSVALTQMNRGVVRSMALDRTARRAVTGTNQGDVILWDATTGALIENLRDQLLSMPSSDPDKDAVVDVGFLDDRYLYAVFRTGDIGLYDLESKRGGALMTDDIDLAHLYEATIDPVTHQIRAVGGSANWDSDLVFVASLPADFQQGIPMVEWKRVSETDAKSRTSVVASSVARSAARAVLVDDHAARVIELDTGSVIAELSLGRQAVADLPHGVVLAADAASAIVAFGSHVDRLDLATMVRTRLLDRTASVFASCGSSLAFSDSDGVSLIRDVAKPTALVKLTERVASALAFSAGCRELVASSAMNMDRQLPAAAIQRYAIDGTPGEQIEISPRAFLGGSMAGVARKWTAFQDPEGAWAVQPDGEPAQRLTGDLSLVRGKAVSASGAWTLERAGDREIVVTETDSGTVLARLTGAEAVTAIQFDGSNTLHVHLQSGWSERWDLARRHRLTAHGTRTAIRAVSPDGARAIADGGAGLVVVAPNAPEVPLTKLAGHTSPVVAASIVGSHALTAAKDGTLRLWDLATGDSLAFAFIGDQWIQYTSDGYFNASPDGADLVSVVDGDRAYEIDQLAAQYNRPDLLFERFRLATPPIRAALAARVVARQRRAGVAALEAGRVQLPRATIKGSTRKDGALLLAIEATATGAPLARVRVDLNGVPVATRDVTGRSARIEVPVELSIGANRIEVTAIDSAGIESYRAQIAARHVGKLDVTPQLHVITFGVSNYARAELRLGLAAKDAGDLAVQLEALRGNGYQEVHVTTFVDAQVNTAAIAKARALLARTRVEDTVVIFIAGHGLLDPDSGTYYYLPHRADPDDLPGTAITFDDLESLAAATPSRRKLVLMDTCDSGEWDPSDLALASAMATKAGIRARSLVRVGPAAAGPPRLPAAYRESLLFRDVFRRSGAIVLSSSRGGELSYEDDAIGNGMFTHALLRALTTAEADADGDGSVMIRELRDYVAAKVAALTGDQQHPTIDRDNRHVQLGFPITKATTSIWTPPAAPRGARGCGCSGAGPDAPGAFLLLIVGFGVSFRRRQPPN